MKGSRPKVACHPETRSYDVQPQPSPEGRQTRGQAAWKGAAVTHPHPRSTTEGASPACASTKMTRTRATPEDWSEGPRESKKPRWAVRPGLTTRRRSAEIRR
ncbi:hypothetical protein PF006_g31711 [Phytophthora fragariae]|uniref:Uncharacterized protein n=1 Tax=Phytophthora fragariae TaxID=53985 RepID=A0A6A3PU25_9STRA|nr:hypothetical protein PF006_g31711 [Phytophthora fragariae]